MGQSGGIYLNGASVTTTILTVHSKYPARNKQPRSKLRGIKPKEINFEIAECVGWW